MRFLWVRWRKPHAFATACRGLRYRSPVEFRQPILRQVQPHAVQQTGVPLGVSSPVPLQIVLFIPAQDGRDVDDLLLMVEAQVAGLVVAGVDPVGQARPTSGTAAVTVLGQHVAILTDVPGRVPLHGGLGGRDEEGRPVNSGEGVFQE